MDLQERLNQEGLRLTHPRIVVMSILNEAQVPLSPQSIHQRAVVGGEDIGLVSVYRTLDLLAQLALVRRVHGRDDCHGYVLASPGHHHHLVCRECERAIEFTGGDDLSTLLQRIQRQTGFEVDDHLLQLYGLCPDCQTHQNNKE
ncbi:MAG: Fur family transcriptional regulator [Chloroflexota bacterium]|nr:Fur family transcriptional regulator [Chloroflexota bacterium]